MESSTGFCTSSCSNIGGRKSTTTSPSQLRDWTSRQSKPEEDQALHRLYTTDHRSSLQPFQWASCLCWGIQRLKPHIINKWKVITISLMKCTEEQLIMSIKIKQLILHQVCFISSTGILLNKAPYIYCQATAKEDSLQNQISCGCLVYK